MDCSVPSARLTDTGPATPPPRPSCSGRPAGDAALPPGTARIRRDGAGEEELLNRLAAIQAAVEILEDNQDLSPGDRQVFLLVIRTETTRLHRLLAG